MAGGGCKTLDGKWFVVGIHSIAHSCIILDSLMIDAGCLLHACWCMAHDLRLLSHNKVELLRVVCPVNGI